MCNHENIYFRKINCLAYIQYLQLEPYIFEMACAFVHTVYQTGKTQLKKIIGWLLLLVSRVPLKFNSNYKPQYIIVGWLLVSHVPLKFNNNCKPQYIIVQYTPTLNFLEMCMIP